MCFIISGYVTSTNLEEYQKVLQALFYRIYYLSSNCYLSNIIFL